MYPAAPPPFASPAVFDVFLDNFDALTTVYLKFIAFLGSDSGHAVILFLLYSAGTFVAITAPAWMFSYFSRKKKFRILKDALEAEVNGGSPEALIEGLMAGDEFSRGSLGEDTVDDAEYAMKIQTREALLASSSIQEPISKQEPQEDVSGSFCEICLENKENWQMFSNDECSHAFCYNCMRSYIVSKIQDKEREIPCPGVNCRATVNFNYCRQMIPNDTLVKWDEFLCTSLIPESQKVYCPFRDCSTMLINDSADTDQIIGRITCAACKRPFCTECHVPWHSEFTCKEFQKLYGKKGGKGDKIVKTLAKKKSWQKCPKCKMYVEKSEGCVHITCRCKYEFCYRCGSKWSDSHAKCRPKLSGWGWLN